MKIGEIITGIKNPFPLKEKMGVNSEKIGNEVPFKDVLTDFVKQVNDEQLNSNKLTDDFIQGKGVELHDVMIAGEKAKTSLELLMEIRNKAIDMYKELTRIQ